MGKFAIVGLALLACGGSIVRPVEAHDRVCKVEFTATGCDDADQLVEAVDVLCAEAGSSVTTTTVTTSTTSTTLASRTDVLPTPCVPSLPSEVDCRHYNVDKTKGLNCYVILGGVRGQCRKFVTNGVGQIVVFGCKFPFLRGE